MIQFKNAKKNDTRYKMCALSCLRTLSQETVINSYEVFTLHKPDKQLNICNHKYMNH